jgi:hypothetical protein
MLDTKLSKKRNFFLVSEKALTKGSMVFLIYLNSQTLMHKNELFEIFCKLLSKQK